MAVFRVKKDKNYTVMANYHLQDIALSLKAKGLLSLMLSLPDNWDYTTKGLASICKDGVDSIRSTIKELEEHGYIIRQRIRNGKGHLTTVEYSILECPKSMSANGLPKRENPILDAPVLEKPKQENPDQLSTKELSTKELNTKELINTPAANATPLKQLECQGVEETAHREAILKSIKYDAIMQSAGTDCDVLNRIVELLYSTTSSKEKVICIAGDDFPIELVKSRFLKLDSSHIQYVLDTVDISASYIQDTNKYLLAALFNASSIISEYQGELANK